MSSKHELKTLLEGISQNAHFTTFNYESPEKFLIKLKCHIAEDVSCDAYNEITKDWLEKFSKFTCTAWIVRRSYPNLKRMLFRKVYACHHSGCNKMHTTKKKNKDCRAMVDFKIKKINRNTIKNDKSLREGLNMHVHVDFSHTHSVRAAESYNSLKCLPETDALFHKYIERGYTIPIARKYHELTILCKYGPVGEERLLNANENPSLSHVTYLYKKMKHILLVATDFEKIMEDKQAVLEEKGGALSYLPDLNMAAAVTPFMKNVLGSYELDNVLIDSCSIRNDMFVTFFFVPTELGALPIACAVYSDQSEPTFSKALFSIKMLLEKNTLKCFDPQIIIMNNLKEQTSICDAIFPGKKTIVSRASFCEEIWALICEDKSKIYRKYKLITMRLFHSLLHSDNSEHAQKIYTELLENNLVKSVPKLKEYLDRAWENRDDYILQTNNILIDMSIRILREFSLHTCKSFTTTVMVDVLMNILDNYWSRILHCHLRRQSIAETYTLFLPKNRDVFEVSTLAEKVDENTYCLDCGGKSMWRETYINFTTDTWVCDCAVGKTGRFCEHLCAILHTINISEITVNIPADKRAIYSEIAGGIAADEVAATACSDVVPIKLEIQDQLVNSDDNTSEINDEPTDAPIEENIEDDSYYYVVEKRERNDPLEGNDHDDGVQVSVAEERDNKSSYESALKSLNDEFRRLNRLFKSNPNAYNMATMERLARELAKIRPLEKVNLSNMHVRINGDNNNMDTSD